LVAPVAGRWRWTFPGDPIGEGDGGDGGRPDQEAIAGNRAALSADPSLWCGGSAGGFTDMQHVVAAIIYKVEP